MKKLFLFAVTAIFLTACTTMNSVNEYSLTYVGQYTSVRGVKDPLSCYCPEGGYIDTCSGVRIPICFEGKAPPDDCREIELTGHYTTADLEPLPDNSCPEGPFRYLLVETWKCL